MISTSSPRHLLAICVLISLASVPAPAHAEGDSAAHALAERFSNSATPAAGDAQADHNPAQRGEHTNADAEAQRKADETDMLARARAEAEARAAAAAAQAEAEAALRAAEEARLAAEQARQLNQQRHAAEQAERQRKARAATANERRVSGHNPTAGVGLESQREREAASLAEKLRRTRENRSALGGDPYRDHSSRSSRYSAADAPAGAATKATHVTVLLTLEPGSKGIRRWNKNADPILCVAESCYVSRGAGEPAQKMPRWQAFGPFVALGSRAGACSNALQCVFRDVDLEHATALIQPVDLRILHHDRRQAQEAEADTSCRVRRQALTCSKTLSGGDWSAWVVPEGLAARAGAATLEAALTARLEAVAAQLGGR